ERGSGAGRAHYSVGAHPGGGCRGGDGHPRGGADPDVQPPRQGRHLPVDKAVSEANASGYDGLVLPGGVANPDRARMEPEAVRFVRSFFDLGKPVAAICHPPWMLIEADVVRGRTVTSWPSLKTDLRNAGATWVDEQVVVEEGLSLVTSRKPDDLDAFCAAATELFAGGGRQRRTA